jgi:hypothetical protein
LIIVENSKAKISCFYPRRQKENKLGTCDSDDERPKGKLCKKENHCVRDCVLFKE